MEIRIVVAPLLMLLASLGPATSVGPAEVPYDLVIAGGRVMDPASGLDGPFQVGIRGESIAAVTDAPLRGERTIDAKGMVVSPGFIDLLSYDPVEPGIWTKLADGVTTNLAMHGGTASPAAWYAAMAARKLPLHYGASFFYIAARLRYTDDRYAGLAAEDRSRMVDTARKALAEGALGVSFSLEYVPGISGEEIVPMMRLAREHDLPVFFHTRYSDPDPPGTGEEGLEEVIAYAEATGASIHIDHITSTGGTFAMPQAIDLLKKARGRGLDVTACLYPYAFWGTYLNSARFDPGWQRRFRISYGDLQLAGSGERLTEASFKKYRKAGKLAVAYAIPETDVEAAIGTPFIFIGSDAILEPGFNNHPRASGTFSRTIAVYVRERRLLTLMQALEKMTILPARRMERAAPAMRKKGRLAVGADADIVVFDPERIRDRATVEHPEIASEGFRAVIVSGRVVVLDGVVDRAVRAGKPIRAPGGNP